MSVRTTPNVRPNRRVKLAGDYRSKGNGMLGASAHELTFTYAAPCWHVARRLSAIR